MPGTYLYAGLAGDTGPGHERQTGLYRSRDGDGPWELVGRGIVPAPEVRAIATDPRQAASSRASAWKNFGSWRSPSRARAWANCRCKWRRSPS